jgi:type IV pilus assembly protein PilC
MKFNYLVRNKEGEPQTGVIEAPNKAVATEALQEKGFIVIRLTSKQGFSLFSKEIKFLNRVKKKDVFVFFRQLSVLTGAGVPLTQSLRTLANQVESDYLKDIILEVVKDVEGGTAFSKALGKHKKVFSPFAVSLIKSAEVSGRLQESLQYLADYLEREYYLISKVRGALIYPAFILGVFVIIAILVLVMVIPQLTAILKEAGQDLPWSTKIVIFTSEFVRIQGWWLALIVIGVGIAGWRYTKTEKGKYRWDKLKLRLPLVGSVLKKTYLSRLADNLNALFKGGVSIIQSIDVSADVIGNEFLKRILLKTKEDLKKGKTIISSLEKYEEFPSMFVQMIRTGEQTGKLESILNKLSEFYNKEVRNVVNNLTQLIEPILIVGLGIGVAILVFSVFMPIYNLAGAF